MAQFVPVVIILELDAAVYLTPFTSPDSYAGARGVLECCTPWYSGRLRARKRHYRIQA
ncbi:hypothetical protein TcasGA2_TC014585 [Tribolium castaneum]|uniref:Uncharacterized protein n=1 Tax=Tribolium castaneum TaxID=7070 RepID=D6WMM0_TRICA|nr:hypothetical protein TcasGA2_TC014585 [Tribolium castaneum]